MKIATSYVCRGREWNFLNMSNRLTISLKTGIIAFVTAAICTCPAYSEPMKQFQLFKGNRGEAGSGTVSSDTRKLSKFTTIVFAAAGHVQVNAGKKPHKVEITVDDNLLPMITTTVENETLTIGSSKPFNSKQGLKVTVDTESLQSITLKGAGTIDVVGLKGKSFEAVLSGTGDIKASGAVDSASATIKGSGSIKLTELKTKNASAKVSGAGNIAVFASESLDATVSGAGNIECAGQPKITKNITGAGDVITK